MKLAVIPARGGSKRIPGKNVKFFCGKPMIGWSIEVARQSGIFDHVVVSTDDAEIAEIAVGFGAEVPFLRPTELSDDYTGTSEVVAHAINWHQQQGATIDAVCCVYATAPFVSSSDLQAGLCKLLETSADFVFAVTSYAYPIQRALRLSESGRVQMLWPEHFTTRSQDLEEVFHDAGQFYWGRPGAWISNKPIFSSTSASIVLPRYRVQDIDTQEDWVRAEMMFKMLQK